MNIVSIDIAKVISPDLKSRIVVRDLNLYIHNLGLAEVIVDFSNVKFATRSFIDEFYNTFLKPKDEKTKVTLVNVSSDLQALFVAVKSTQKRPKPIDNSGSVVYLDSISEIKKFFSNLAL